MDITLTPEMEKKIAALAHEAGTSVDDYLMSLVSRLPEPKQIYESASDLSAKLRQWQAADGSPLLPDTSARSLFTRWRAEDDSTSEEERQKEYALWLEIEKSLQSQTGLVL